MQELAWIVEDKLAHAQAGFGIGLFLAVALMVVWRGRFHELAVLVPFFAPIFVAAVAGVGKEFILDPVADMKDLQATVLGGFGAASIVSFLNIMWILYRYMKTQFPQK